MWVSDVGLLGHNHRNPLTTMLRACYEVRGYQIQTMDEAAVFGQAPTSFGKGYHPLDVTTNSMGSVYARAKVR